MKTSPSSPSHLVRSGSCAAILGIALALLAACKGGKATTDAHDAAPSATVSVTTVPTAAPSVVPSAKADACGAYRNGHGPRVFGYHIPGDPASHPGCTLDESGGLQCPEDFAGWDPKSKVKVSPTETKNILDAAERTALAMGCNECPRKEGNYPAGYNPSHYPARLCNSSACTEVCDDTRQKLPELRRTFAGTKTPTKTKIEVQPTGRPTRE